MPTARIKLRIRRTSHKKAPAIKVFGKVMHYYGRIGVAVVKAASTIKVGDRVKFRSYGEDIEQEVTSLQIDHASVDSVRKGEEVGMKVSAKVRPGSLILAA